MREASHFRLTADQGDLTTFESELAAFAGTGLLTFRTTASSRTAAGTVTARDALRTSA
jgi:hypothetical protein